MKRLGISRQGVLLLPTPLGGRAAAALRIRRRTGDPVRLPLSALRREAAPPRRRREGAHSRGCRVGRGRSLGQVVEAHGHTDVAGEADVDAEVDQPLFPGACEDVEGTASFSRTGFTRKGKKIPLCWPRALTPQNWCVQGFTLKDTVMLGIYAIASKVTLLCCMEIWFQLAA